MRRFTLDLTPLRTSRDFRLVFAATGVSGFGSFITYVTVPYQVAVLTGDPLLVGLLGVCELAPLILMAFVGGALADYLDRRHPRRDSGCQRARRTADAGRLAGRAVAGRCADRVGRCRHRPTQERPTLRSIRAGLRYAVGRQELLGTYLVDINAMLFAMPQALYPFLAGKLGGPAVLGLLYAAPSVGSLLATLTSGWTGRVHRHGLAVTLAAAGWGLAIVGVGLADSLWLVLLCLLLAGAADMVSGLFRMTMWNQTIPDRLRGRLAGIEMLSYSTGPLLGNVRAGLAARSMGIGGAVVSGGLLCLAGTAVLALALPRFIRYDSRQPQPEASPP